MTPFTKRFAAPTSPPHIATLIVLTALAVASGNMFLPSLPSMARDFEIDYATMNLSIAGYLAVTGVLQLVIGPLSDRYGRRPVLLGALGVYVVGSIGCVLAQDLWTFLAFRVVQGAVIAGWALSQAIIRDTREAGEAASLMGYVSMAMALAPMLGPLFGGVLDEIYGWRANFIAFSLFGAVAFVVSWADVGETNRNRSATFLKQIQSYPELLRSGLFWGYTLCMAFSTGAFYAYLTGAPLVASSALGLTPASIGFWMGMSSAGFLFGSFLAGRFAAAYPLTTMMIAGRLIACAGLGVGLLFVASGVVTELTIFGSAIFLGIGNGVTMPSANAGALSVRPSLAGSAAGLSGALLVGIGALISAGTGAIVSPQDGAAVVLGVMLGCSAIGLIASLAIRSSAADGRNASSLR